MRSETEPMPAELRSAFGLPLGASYAEAATRLMARIAEQKSLAPSNEFPRNRKSPAAATEGAAQADIIR